MIKHRSFMLLGLVALASITVASCRRNPCFANPLRSECVISDTTEDLWPDPVDRTRVHLNYLVGQVRQQFERTGRLPTSLPELFPGDPGADPGRTRLDAWKHEVGYTVLTEDRFELRSAGVDGTMRTSDDIVVTGSASQAGR